MGRIELALVPTAALGLLSRLWPVGCSLYDKSLGDVAYAATAYLGLALIRPRWGPTTVAIVALGWCVAVECFLATGIPMQYVHLGAVRWLLGTTFAWHDLACYGVGVMGLLLLDLGCLRPRGRPSG